MEWLVTGGSLHLERSPHSNFDMGIWGGGGSAAIFPVYTVLRNILDQKLAFLYCSINDRILELQ